MCVSRLRCVVAPAGPGHVEVEDPGGQRSRVSLLALDGPPPEPGEWLVVHSGFALDRADAAGARAAADELRPWLPPAARDQVPHEEGGEEDPCAQDR